MNRERLDGWCEKGILGLVLAVLVYGPLATGAVRPQDFLIIQGLTVVALTFWALRFWLNPEHRLLWPPVCWAVLLFVIYAIVRYFYADVEYVARQELIQILVYASLFFLILNNLNRSEHSQWVAFVMVGLGVAISAYAIYQFSTKSGQVWHFIRPPQYAGRGSGTYICPNHFAGFLELLLPLALAYTIAGRVGHVTRLLLGYGALVITAGIVTSLSRGGIIATIVTLILFFAVLVRRPGYRIPAFILLAVVLGGGIWFISTSQFTQRRFSSAVQNGEVADIRFELWQPAIRLWQDHLWWGAGPGHFDQAFPRYRPEIVQQRPGWAHNDYLNTLADYGLVGGLLVIGVWSLTFWSAGKVSKSVQRTGNGISVPKSNRTAFTLGAALALVAILLHSWVDFNLHVPANAILTVTWIALLASFWRYATEQYWLKTGTAVRALATLITLAAVAYLADQGWRGYQVWAGLRPIQPGKTPIKTALPLLKRAHAIDPANPNTTYRLGEAYRALSFDGADDYPIHGREAIRWFELSAKANPLDAMTLVRHGMCLDWLDQNAEADKFFQRASELDPNNYQIVAYQGWHLIQLEKFAQAKPVLERSLKLMPSGNQVAESYLPIAIKHLAESK